MEHTNKGKVYVVGVGPGDYKLLTLKAMECIKKGDVLVYDRLINNRILGLAKKGAEKIYVGKLPDYHGVPQEQINEILAIHALEGKIVTRIKGGDPYLFGRGGEEGEYLFERGIDFEVIPGITSAISVPAYGGIPVTHRDYCSSLHIITGHERPDKQMSNIDFEPLAKVGGTLVFLMGVKNLPNISNKLMEYGMDENTPVAVIENGTTGGQRSVIGTLSNISKEAENKGIKSPAVTVVGKVVELHKKLNWFERGSFFGKKILVTRAREQASGLCEKIEELGGQALLFPTISIEKPLDFKAFDTAIHKIEKFNWVVFTSINGVKAFFERLREKKVDIRKLNEVKFSVIGQGTREELENMGIFPHFEPSRFTSEELLKGMLQIIKPSDKILLARSDIGDKELCNGFINNGNYVEDLCVYRTVPVTDNREEVKKLLESGDIDIITFTSSSTVKNFVAGIGKENLGLLKGVKAVSIGPVTSKTAKELGIEVGCEAKVHTIDGILDALKTI